MTARRAGVSVRLLYAGIIGFVHLAQPAFFALGEESDADFFAARLRPFLARHCETCHRGDRPRGDLRLDELNWNLAASSSLEKWSLVLEKLRTEEMPPADQPRPPRDETEALINWLTPRVGAAAAAAREANGRVVLRRLNRVEYQNTLCDLLGIDIEVQEQLPQDGAADGFDKAGAAHHTSSFLLEKYLDAADAALNLAICNDPKPPEQISQRYSLRDGHPIRSTQEDVYRFRDDGEVVCFSSSEWHNVWVSSFYPKAAGKYRFRISASAIQSADNPVLFRVTITGARLTGMNGLIDYFAAPPQQPTLLVFERYMQPRTTIALLPYGLAHANTVKQVGGEKWDGPGLAVQYVEIEGPLHETWPPASHRRLFGDLPQQKAAVVNWRERVEVTSERPREDGQRILKNFARRAFRRVVTDEELAPYQAVLAAKLEAGESFEKAVRAALKGILISPEFLFLHERPGRLDDFALASRLSYFLWSSMPDEELFKLAEQSRLSDRVVLREQVERLLQSPKAAAFTRNFVGQWLGLREIDATEPSHLLYPEFDHLLKVSMIRETELFFEELLRNDLSVTHFVSSDFTMLNGRLAKHYGISAPMGWEFQKTPVPADSHRGGVLTMASVLKITANGTTTSPVLRGAWILDRILGTPSPPPPDNIAAIDPDVRGAVTIREQLAKHRADAACSVCHDHIDPPGFALENFDCIGGWRTHYRVTGSGEAVVVDGRRMPYHRGKMVDAAGVMPDGEPFDDIDQYKQILARDRERLARAVTNKLVAYATGRAAEAADRGAVDQMVAEAKPTDFGLRSLVHAVVQSELFRNK